MHAAPWRRRAANVRALLLDNRLFLAIGAGLCAAACFFPLPWGLNGALILVAFIPLLEAARGAGWLRGAWYAAVTGFIGCAVAFHWLLPLIARFSALPLPAAVLVFVAGQVWAAVFWATWGALWGARGVGPWLVVLAPVALECVWPRIFRWHFGDPLTEIPALAQIADAGGMPVRSLLVLTVNYGLWRVSLWLRRKIPFPRAAAAATAGALALALGYGAYRLAETPPPTASLQVALVHTAIPLEDKHRLLYECDPEWVDGRLVVKRRETYLAHERELVARGKAAAADLVVIPEAMLCTLRSELMPRLGPAVGAAVFVGSDVLEPGAAGARLRVYNAAILETGKERQFYYKYRLMPFGEEVPLARQFPLIGELIGVGTIERGEGVKTLALGSHKLAPLICYEVIVPEYVTAFVRAGAEVLVNITEDGWYGWTGEPYQHLLLARGRAVECRRALVRCVNNGISAIVDPMGRVTACDADRRTPGVVRGRVELRTGLTPYTRWHEWIDAAMLAAGAALALGAWRREKLLKKSSL